MASTPQSIVITNCGTKPLQISSTNLVGAAAGDFAVASSCALNSDIAPGGTCTITVTFTPTVAGLRQATLLVGNNASAPISILCEGTGFIPTPSLCVESTFNLGSVAFGSTGVVQTLILTNCGTAPLLITNSPVLTGGDAGEFIIQFNNGCSNVLPAGICTIGLQFAPTNGGLRSATLSIFDNIADNPQTITLMGDGDLSQPDAAIGKNTNLKKMKGFGIITNAAGSVLEELIQNVSRTTPKAIEEGKHGVTYYVAVKNIGSGDDQFDVQSTQISGQNCANVPGGGFTVKYYLGAKPADSIDITTAVEAGTFAMGTMGPGAVTADSTMLRVVVFADKTLVPKGCNAGFNLTFTSASDPTRQDTVRITAIAK
jgi:hypothetical protein